ncbi:MAG TPA: glucose-6-phosphate isomerase, partial [Thermoanaerobaculia bacterium]|nr:glucose-6-phosphate isomerase [Thermoanaerobaculia bacterium]
MSLHPWQRYQALSLHVPSLSLLVDLSKTSLLDDALHRDPLVLSAFPAAFAAMEALEAGAIANPDENRRVGHYWLRAPERAPDAETAEAIRGTLTRIEGFAEAVHAGGLAPQKAPRFMNLLVVGIGGSALGPQFVADALGSPRDPLRPFFFDNTDPDGMARELSRIAATEGGLPATLTVVISK